ncbi:MAG: hypothetical protein K2K57_11945 [Oscillospiraceae bacterium]|nr:hypothetical protein [Oscillospiraceae bacterium]
MSGSKRYKDDFDRHAGTPAEFDSLFVFENGELRAKKHIRKASGGRHTLVGLVTAAAVMVAAGAALSAVSRGGMPTVGELAPGDDIGETTVAVTTAVTVADGADVIVAVEPDVVISYEEEIALMSDEIEALREFDRFDYSVIPSFSTAAVRSVSVDSMYADVMSTSDIILTGTVRDKSYDDSTGEIIYEIFAAELYSKADATPLLSEEGNIMNVHCTFGGSIGVYDELQIGSEYIMPIIIGHEGDEETAYLADSDGKCIRKINESETESGWEMDSDVYANLLTVIEKTADSTVRYRQGSGVNTAVVDNEAMQKGLEEFFAESGRAYLSEHTTMDTEADSCTLSEIFISEGETGGFEQVRYLETETGTDMTTLVLENENHFVLAPEVNGEVVYAGESLSGENIIRLKVYNINLGDISIMFAGDMEIECDVHEDVYGQVLGSCYATPIYCRIIGSNGKPMVVVL